MPKVLLLVLAVAALAIAACHGSSSSPTPTPSPASPSPNPSVSMATILVTINGTPVPKIPVEESTPRVPASPRPGKPFFIKDSGKKGYARFSGLKPSGTYCWVAVFGSGFKSSECAGWAVWQTSIIYLGT
ncbi:MAG TPA: hypothetical protein VFF63_03865 [Candidatus Babeliales bacterium]|nr:hypothetical protein [Candidatus Babeliales bacterium]